MLSKFPGLATVAVAAACFGCAAGSDNTSAAGGVGGAPPDPPTSATQGSSSSSSATSSSAETSTTSTSSSTSTDATSTSTGATGGGGAGGTGGMGGSGGTGGSGGAGGAGPTQRLGILATGPSGAFGSIFKLATETWTTTTLAGSTDTQPGFTFNGTGLACGAYRRAGSTGELDFAIWQAGVWSTFSQISNNTTLAPPGMTGSAGLIDSLFEGSVGAGLNKFYFERRDATWAAAAEAVTPQAGSQIGVQSFGPSQIIATARVGADTWIAYRGQDAGIYTQARKAGIWQSPEARIATGTSTSDAAIATLTGATNLMVAYVDGGGALGFAVHTSAGWTVSAPIFSSGFGAAHGTPSIAAAANGDAILAWRDASDLPHWARWATATGAWSNPKAIGSATSGDPKLAPGVGDADAELVFVDGASAVQHGRLKAGTFTVTAVPGITGATHASIAAEP